jgi:drug/metabolite transporter (DMT)-like permease
VIAFLFTTATVFIVDPPYMLSGRFFGIALIIAIIEIGYLFPYYWSLREIDTSVVASLFSLGKVFIPLFAFFVLSERLALIQYFGFFLIIGSSAALSFDRTKLKLNRSFFFMAIVSLVLMGEAILYKYSFAAGATWGRKWCIPRDT